MRVLLTGGTGYLGGAILEELLAGGHEILLFSRSAPGPSRTRVTHVAGDVRDADAVRRAIDGVDGVIHAAAHVRNWDRDRRRFEDVNVGGARVVLGEAARARISRIVLTSSFIAIGPSTGGPPIAAPPEPRPRRYRNDYERTKSEANARARELQREGLPLTIVYPTVVYGPGKRTEGNHVGTLLFALAAGKLPGIVGDGRPTWNFAYLPDVARGHRQAIERGGSGALILGGENLTVAGFVAAASQALGVPPPARRLGYFLPSAIGAVLEVRAALFGIPPELTRGETAIYRDDWAFTSDAAEAALGYRRTPLSEALANTAAWVREEMHRVERSRGRTAA